MGGCAHDRSWCFCLWRQLIETYHSAGKTSAEIPDLGPVELVFHEMCTEMNNRQALMAANKAAAGSKRAASKLQREAEGRPGVVAAGSTARTTAHGTVSTAQRVPQAAPPASIAMAQLLERTIAPLTPAQVASLPGDSPLAPLRKWVPGGVRCEWSVGVSVGGSKVRWKPGLKYV